MELMIIDKNGWSKILPIQKAITRIGSDPTNEIQLESDLISPVHLQIIYSPEYPSRCKLINLSDEVIVHTGFDDITLLSYQTIDLRDGFEIKAGGFRLIPKLPLAAGTMQTSNKIDASLSFPDPILRPGYPAVGYLTITNKGDQPDCQFDITLQGLAEDCWEVDPIPLMYPGAQESTRVELFHRGHYPEAGSQEIILSITAPEHYPSEELVIKQEVIVLPVYKQSLEIIDDVVEALTDPAQMEADPGKEDGVEINAASSMEPPSSPEKGDGTHPDPEPSGIHGEPMDSTTQARDLSKLKVISETFDEFWEEE
jgi:hypothetical protein